MSINKNPSPESDSFKAGSNEDNQIKENHKTKLKVENMTFEGRFIINRKITKGSFG